MCTVASTALGIVLEEIISNIVFGKAVQKKQEKTYYDICRHLSFFPVAAVCVLVKDGNEWKKLDPSDYTVTYLNNVKKGTATILVTGKGDKAAGSRTAKFKIKAGKV